MLLRKIILFAITSGLAKKAYDHFRASKGPSVRAQRAPRQPTHGRATTVSPVEPSA